MAFLMTCQISVQAQLTQLKGVKDKNKSNSIVANSQCPPLSILLESLGQGLAGYHSVMEKGNFGAKDVNTIRGQTITHFIPDSYEESVEITIITDQSGKCTSATLKSAQYDCWAAFLTLVKADPKTFNFIAGPNEELGMLGTYLVSEKYLVSGTFRKNSEGRVVKEIRAMAKEPIRQNNKASESTQISTPKAVASPVAAIKTYDRQGIYYEGMARVEKNKKYGYIDENKKEIIPVIYDYGADFKEEMAGVKKDGKYGFLNKQGILVIPFQYDEFFSGYSHGLASVRLGSKWGFINKQGTTIIPFIYQDATIFREGLAAVQLNEKWGLVNTKGVVVIPIIHEHQGSCYNGLVQFEVGKKYGFYTNKGVKIIPAIYDNTFGWKDGKIVMVLDGKNVYFDKTGKKME